MAQVRQIGTHSGRRPAPWRVALAALLAALVLAAAACTGDTTEADSADSADSAENGAGRSGEVTVVATTSILRELVTNVARDDAEVATLLPTGADPHSFQPSARDAAALLDADLVVAVGLDLEHGFEDLLAEAADETTVLEIAPLVDPLPSSTGTDLDPHVWMDPLRMTTAVEEIAAALSEIESRIDWRSRADAYSDRLRAAHEEIEELLAPVPEASRRLVTNHDSLGYLAARYGFEITATIIPGGSTLAEPSARSIAELAETIRREEVPAIFAETTHPTRLADALATELDGEIAVVTLFTDSLGEGDSEAATYPGMLVENARRIAAALAPEASPSDAASRARDRRGARS